MDRAQALFPHLSLDPKRIAGTSVAILVHLLVLMLLLLPAQTSPSMSLEDESTMIVVPDYKRPPPPPPPPREVRQLQARTPVQTPSPPTMIEPVEQTQSAVDIYVPATPDNLIVDTFEPTPPSVFEQIKADVAPPPPYPAMALKRHVTGEVTLRVRVDTQGRPVSAIIERSSGSKLLDEAARKFVLARWHFVPAVRDGGPVEAEALVPINFVIEN